MSVSMHVSAADPRPSSRRPVAVLAVWASLSFAFAVSEALTLERMAIIPALIVAGVALVFVGGRFVPDGRRFFAELDLRWFFALHALRLPMGALFLYELGRGRLNPDFAVPAGVGDIAVGLLAASLLAFPRLAGRRTVLAFNWIGLVDILVAVASAQRVLFFGDRSTMTAFLDAPYPMIPTFVVPLVIGTHLLMFGRLRRSR